MNASEKRCWELCTSCYRCKHKGEYAKCRSCTGRHDPEGKRDPYDIDDYCRCTEGILQFRLKNNQLVIRRFRSNPFKGTVTTDAETEDERDWQGYIEENRERLDDEHWDPVKFNDGSSTTDWIKAHREGRAG